MKLSVKDIIGKREGQPVVITLHGPSLQNSRDQISELQREKKLLRISVNEWFDYFSLEPDYWIISNGEFTIEASLFGSQMWYHRKYPPNVFNQFNIPIFYNDGADLSDAHVVEKNLKCDYLPYDTKHFKNHTCREILQNFRKHVEQHSNIDFRGYGNNSQMWQRPLLEDAPEDCDPVHGKIGNAWDITKRCCHKIDHNRKTIQEELQDLPGHEQHVGPGQTVGIFALIFAVLMKCNPIYITGLDLDYSMGYAESDDGQDSFWAAKRIYAPNEGNIGHWKHVYRNYLTDDMRIIKESAEKLGINIVNLNKNAWYDVFDKGDIQI